MSNSFFEKVLELVYDIYVTECGPRIAFFNDDRRLLSVDSFREQANLSNNVINFGFGTSLLGIDGCVEYYADPTNLCVLARSESGQLYCMVQFDTEAEMLDGLKRIEPFDCEIFGPNNDDKWGKPIIKYIREETPTVKSFFGKLLDAVYEVYARETIEMYDEDFAVEVMDFHTFSECAVGEQNHIHFCICDGNEECDVEYSADPKKLMFVAYTDDGQPYRAVQFDSEEEMLDIIRGLEPNEMYELVALDGEAEELGLWQDKPIIKYE